MESTTQVGIRLSREFTISFSLSGIAIPNESFAKAESTTHKLHPVSTSAATDCIL